MSLTARIALWAVVIVSTACNGGVDAVTATATPRIAFVSPMMGPLAGGGTLTITGSGFMGTPSVMVGGAAATGVTMSGGTRITFVVPAGAAGLTSVVVTNANGRSGSLANAYTYLAAPTVTRVSPWTSGTSGGWLVNIFGTGFVAVPTVTFGGIATRVFFKSDSIIDVDVPAHAAGSVDIVVRNADGQADTLANGFEYVAPPTIVAAMPSRGPITGGNTVTLAGSGFVADALVYFGGLPATAVTVGEGGTRITLRAPPQAPGAVNIVVVNPDEQSGLLANAYIYDAVSTNLSIAPRRSPARRTR